MRGLDYSASRRWPRCEGMLEAPDGEGEVLVMKRMSKPKGLQWRPVGLNVACMLASSLAMAHVNGEAQMCAGGDAMELDTQVKNSGEPSAPKVIAGRYGGMGMDNWGTILSLCFMFIVGVSTGFWWKGFHKVARSETSEPSSSSPPPSPSQGEGRTRKVARANSVGSLRQYKLKEIMDMTECFKLQLGRGGQGIVYFASLLEGRGKAAVKRLQKKEASVIPDDSERGSYSQEMIEKAFWAEIKTISKLHHRNLVALLGYCVEEDDLFLVYEFMGKGSLSQRLHPKNPEDAEGMVLDWKARMRCAVEVAQGLEYLHSHASPSLVHRDIKTGNILFDDDMNAKIADFGLSKPVQGDDEPIVSTRVRGTHGYVDPVYLQNGIPCDKNDVYSYGVVLLELITGRRALEKKVSLVQWCKDFLNTDEYSMRCLLHRMVDSKMTPLDSSYDQLLEVAKLARSCVQEKQEYRPTMKDVVAGLYNANMKELTVSTEFPTVEVPLNRFGSNVGSSFDDSTLNNPPTPPQLDCSPSYEIKENSILVKCTVAGSKIQLRCKIWPSPRNFGLNKVEVSCNGGFLWKKGLWWYNAKSSREFTVGDYDIKLIAAWHVTLRTKWETLASDDPRRNQGPFCIEYLALKDKNNVPLVEYHGDDSPLPQLTQQERRPRRESSGSGSGSADRRRSSHHRRPS